MTAKICANTGGKTGALNITAVVCTAAVALGAVHALTSRAGAAEDTTPWDGDARSGVRLVAGAPKAGTPYLRAGVEIRLMRGWHTYWRYPGDAGVPPQFSFEGSRNVKHVDVLWPAPERKVDSGGTSIGYSTGVIFPLRVVPQQAGKPVALRLRLQYAICEKLCVPAEARGELTLASGRASQDAALAAAEGRVPKRLALGEGSELAIRTVRREQGTGNKERAVVDVIGPAGVDLFVEGPTEQWALPVPTPVAGAPPGQRRFVFELDGAPAGESYKGAMLTLTAVAAGRSVEVSTRLD
ncbi:MAG: cytochrome C biogenesis protein [Xanthobacteraceae bacterium]|nr:cytochrome C biogenesis protein [Xanthobacteraceae bacterium]